jgi:hypothetical protein
VLQSPPLRQAAKRYATFWNMLLKITFCFLILIPNIIVLRIIILNRYGIWKIGKVILALILFMLLVKFSKLMELNLNQSFILSLLTLSVIMSILVIIEKEICEPYMPGFNQFLRRIEATKVLPIIYILIITFIQILKISRI